MSWRKGGLQFPLVPGYQKVGYVQQVGKEVKSKEEVCVIESVKAASDIYSPIDGEIIEINKELEKDATIINQDAENKGWIFKIKVTEPNQLDDLMSAEDYSKFLEQ